MGVAGCSAASPIPSPPVGGKGPNSREPHFTAVLNSFNNGGRQKGLDGSYEIIKSLRKITEQLSVSSHFSPFSEPNTHLCKRCSADWRRCGRRYERTPLCPPAELPAWYSSDRVALRRRGFGAQPGVAVLGYPGKGKTGAANLNGVAAPCGWGADATDSVYPFRPLGDATPLGLGGPRRSLPSVAEYGNPHL